MVFLDRSCEQYIAFSVRKLAFRLVFFLPSSSPPSLLGYFSRNVLLEVSVEGLLPIQMQMISIVYIILRAWQSGAELLHKNLLEIIHYFYGRK